ncbi:MAG: Fur family transcriptional regulator [Chloroflexota bacterium]
MAAITGLRDSLEKAGFKITKPRLAVIEVLETHGDHLSHTQILEEAKKIYPKLGRATVYRTLELFVSLNMIRPMYLNEPTQRFISASGGHHHLVCTSCDAIVEFDHCVVEELAQNLAKQFRFQIRNHLLEFQGVCQSCQS